ncbi:hypothetical protein DH2020_003875 [Rehmannia glutinosa]|uniref:Retrotransposon protein, putative, Ty3-gypsy subclass n=1 Tax=Rehmannia glutinosa TaxID=99300 RepID=A0ABR0XN24_REHGL
MGVLCASLSIRPMMIERIKQAQYCDDKLTGIAEKVKQENSTSFVLNDDGSLTINNRLCVRDVDGLRHEIMEEAHTAPYAMHPGTRKNDAVWVIVDRLTKSAHFLPFRCGSTLENQKTICKDEYIALMEFAYNNQHHSSIGMAPYEALYGRKCRNPVCWDEEGIRLLEGPDLIQDTVEKVKIVKSRLKAAQDRQKSYIDQHRREMEYEVGEKVFLRVSPWKGILVIWKER